MAERSEALQRSLAELKRTQAELVTKEKMASLGQLTAGIAHELQNPLNFVQNFADLSVDLLQEVRELVGAVGLSHDQAEQLDELTDLLIKNLASVMANGRRASAIARNMMEYSRLGGVSYEMTDLGALLRQGVTQTLATVPTLTQAAGVDTKLLIDPDLPLAEIAPADIAAVIANLVRNAIYALHERRKMAEPDFKPVLTIAARAVGPDIEIRIHDNGIGIPQTARPRLFTPFFTTKPAGEGTGLGLSLGFDVIVRRHGGRLDIESEEGVFTEARILLPLRLPPLAGEDPHIIS